MDCGQHGDCTALALPDHVKLVKKAMNTACKDHPATCSHLKTLGDYGYQISKSNLLLACGDHKRRLLADLNTILERIKETKVLKYHC